MRIISSQSFFLYAARPTVISTGTEQSGVEWSGEISGPNGTSVSPSHCHFDRNGAKRSGVEKSPAPCCRPIAMGDLSAQSNNRFQTPLSPYRHAAPLEMTYGAGSSTVMGKGNNDTIPPPHCHFDRNGAKRSGMEKSPTPMVPVPPPPTVISTGTEQSGVEWRNLRPLWHRPHCGGRFLGSEPQWSSNTLTFLPTRSPARDDRAASHHFGKFQSIEAKKKEL